MLDRLRTAARILVKGTPHGTGFDFTTRNLQRALYFSRHVDAVRNVPGVFVECGVGRGEGLAIWLALTPQDRLLWAFDSFEGFPKFAPEDETPPEKERGFAHYRAYTVPYVTGAVTRFGISSDEFHSRVRIAKGFMPGSFALYDKNPIALINLDLDLFESYRDALAFFWPLVSEGGVVMFDEYDIPETAAKFPGARKAIDQFLRIQGLEGALERDQATNNVWLRKATRLGPLAVSPVPQSVR
jgi:hypothetical protein